MKKGLRQLLAAQLDEASLNRPLRAWQVALDLQLRCRGRGMMILWKRHY